MHALAYNWGLTLYPSLSVIHSPSLRTIYHYSVTLFCCYIVELLLSDNLVDYDNEVALSKRAGWGCLQTRFQAQKFVASQRWCCIFLRTAKSVQVRGHRWRLFVCLRTSRCPHSAPVVSDSSLLFSSLLFSSLLPIFFSSWQILRGRAARPTRRPRPHTGRSRSESACLTHIAAVFVCPCANMLPVMESLLFMSLLCIFTFRFRVECEQAWLHVC